MYEGEKSEMSDVKGNGSENEWGGPGAGDESVTVCR